jgi:hypothetical protein
MVAGRNSAGINNAGGKSVNPLYKAAQTVTSYVGNVAREVRDIPTSIGAPKRMQTGTKTETYKNEDGTTSKVKVPTYKGNQASGIGSQIKEAAAAITANQKGTSVGHTTASGKTKKRTQR